MKFLIEVEMDATNWLVFSDSGRKKMIVLSQVDY